VGVNLAIEGKAAAAAAAATGAANAKGCSLAKRYSVYILCIETTHRSLFAGGGQHGHRSDYIYTHIHACLQVYIYLSIYIV